MVRKMTQQMEDNIKNYGDEIKTLESFVEAVRLRPGMYIGSIGDKGFLSMIREIFQNSFDELMKDSSPCDEISFIYDQSSHMVIVSDNGRGIPFDNIIRIFSSQHTSSNFTKKAGEYSSGLHGVGSKVTNALSKFFCVESFILGKGRRVEFVDGVPWDKGEQPIKDPDIYQGTRITFVPSLEIMGQLNLPVNIVFDLLSNIILLGKIGARVNFRAIDNNGTTYETTIINENGINQFLSKLSSAPVCKPIYIKNETIERDKKAEIVFTFDSQDFLEVITAYSNFCPTVAGKHIDGFIEGVCKYFRDYMNKIFLSPKSKLKIINNDVRTGLKAVLSVAHLNPIFDGQSKETLANEDMFPFVKDTVISSLDEWSKTNPNDLQKVCKFIKEIGEIRMKSEEGKTKLSTKYSSSSVTGLPSKYSRPIGKEHLELIVVEGDSAGGSAKNVRCIRRQGIIPIRGKLPNAMTTGRKEFLSNAEVGTIIDTVDGGYGKNFDISRVKWEKFIFMTDADFDGFHIRCLLLKMVLVYMLPLLEAGRVYAAIPPLYGVNIKNEYKYFIDRLDFIKYNEKYFSKKYKIFDLTGKKLSSSEIIDILYRNIEYIDDLKSVADKYAINYNLLETVCANIDKPLSKLKMIIKRQYRFMDIYKMNGLNVIKGLVDGKSQLIILNDEFMESIPKIVYNIKQNKSILFQLENGAQISLYDLLDLYSKTQPKDITRYKGLGEMDPNQLKLSTLHPDSDRTLIRYTVEDAKAEIEKIKYFDKNKYELIKDKTISKMDLL